MYDLPKMDSLHLNASKAVLQQIKMVSDGNELYKNTNNNKFVKKFYQTKKNIYKQLCISTHREIWII